MIKLSGFADEAADSIEGQIAATKELGWSWIEARSVGGVNLHDLDDAAFESVCEKLSASGVGVNCLGSTIANWGKDVDEDFSVTMATVKRSILRMKKLGAKFVRIMSYKLYFTESGKLAVDQKAAARIARLRDICGAFAAEGIIPVHENCLNYGGISWRHTLDLLEAVPDMKLVFDTGNPNLTPDFSAKDGARQEELPNQDAWNAWNKLKSYVVHIHVKDGWRDPQTGHEHYVYPGEGPCRVRDILADCMASGYDGWLTIEPHMAVVFHDASVSSPEEQRKAVFVEYGRRLESMLKDLGARVKTGDAIKP